MCYMLLPRIEVVSTTPTQHFLELKISVPSHTERMREAEPDFLDTATTRLTIFKCSLSQKTKTKQTNKIIKQSARLSAEHRRK